MISQIATASYLVCDIEPRYWEDATVNGMEDRDGTLIPLRDGDIWKITLDLATGKILEWPEGVDAGIHYKVCDQGLYWLADAEQNKIARWKGSYVPGEFLCHGAHQSSEYVIFHVGAGGEIRDYQRPSIDQEDWTL